MNDQLNYLKVIAEKEMKKKGKKKKNKPRVKAVRAFTYKYNLNQISPTV